MKHNNLLFQMLFFGCFGITMEIFFTAISKLIFELKNNIALNLSLQGKTYIWMFFIYSLIPIIGNSIYPKVKHWNTIYRILFYVLITYFVEFTLGGFLKLVLGRCPWEYKTGIHVLGLIRLDYFLFWFFGMYLMEKVYVFTTKLKLSTNLNSK